MGIGRVDASQVHRLRSRYLTLPLGALLLVVLAVVLAGSSADAAELGDPVIDGDASDPHLVGADGEYWAYTTNNFLGNVPLWRSTDRENWSWAGDAMPTLGRWAVPGHTWAPGVIRVGDRWVLFYTARDGLLGIQCIGRAEADNPWGPFVDDSLAPFVCQPERSGSIDPYPFRQGDDLYLIWKSDDNAVPGTVTYLWSQRLDATGEHLVGAPAPLLAGDLAWERPLIENPAMVEANGSLILFYSANWWESDRYGMGYAVCDSPLGPCHKQTNHGPWVGSTPHVAGPGGQAILADADGSTWIVYHGWPPGRVGYAKGGSRSMYLDRVTFAGSRPVPHGSLAGSGLPTPTGSSVVGVAETGAGFWTVDGRGGVRNYDGAAELPDMAGHWLNRPIVGMASTPSGQGYWLVASDGGIFSFGDASFFGSTGAMWLNRPIVGMASTPSGQGYWLVASDGGIFAFGDAPFKGSTGAMYLSRPIVGMAASRDGLGYWLAAGDGGVFSFGAPYSGAVSGTHLKSSWVAGIVSRPNGGYSLVNIAGQVWRFR